MKRGFEAGIIIPIVLALISAAMYPRYSASVARAIHDQTRLETGARDHATRPALVDLFIHHVPSAPTR